MIDLVDEFVVMVLDVVVVELVEVVDVVELLCECYDEVICVLYEVGVEFLVFGI